MHAGSLSLSLSLCQSPLFLLHLAPGAAALLSSERREEGRSRGARDRERESIERRETRSPADVATSVRYSETRESEREKRTRQQGMKAERKEEKAKVTGES